MSRRRRAGDTCHGTETEEGSRLLVKGCEELPEDMKRLEKLLTTRVTASVGPHLLVLLELGASGASLAFPAGQDLVSLQLFDQPSPHQ